MSKTFKTTINGQPYQVDDSLTGFTILSRSSSLVEFIAVKDDKLFIQFNKGISNGIMYENLPIDVIKQATTAVSIGKFYHSVLKDKYDCQKVGQDSIRLYLPVTSDIEDDFTGVDDEDDY